MIRKTMLLTGVAGALLFAAPALAQDPTATPAPTQDPMTQAPATPEAGVQAETQTQAVSPGAQVKASDGAELGVLEGAGVDAAGQQTLQVRADTGELKAAPITGASLQDGAVVLAWTEAEFDAAPSVMDNTADASATETETAPAEETAPVEGTAPADEAMPEAQPAPEAPVTTTPPVDEELPGDESLPDQGDTDGVTPLADPMA